MYRSFETQFDQIVAAGLAWTPYQQTDDTSARVDGEFWHTHVLCNPYYAAYFTRPHKDRLTLLEQFVSRYWDFYQSLQDYRAGPSELLTVLDEPWLPLHNNASELQARVSARRRDVSLHSRSTRGARAMDIFTTIVQTSKLLGISSYAYLRDRISKTFDCTSLAQEIQLAAQTP